MSRFYQQLNHDIVSAKNRLHRLLQLTFPKIENCFQLPLSNNIVGLCR